jgi:HD-GYP domain-containing protein (c-di-GMP phosphodiesterase class II)
MDIRFLFRIAVLFVLLANVAGAAAAGPDVRAAEPDGPKVLVIHSYAQDYVWTRDLHAGIVSVLDDPAARARWRVEYMDAKHHFSPSYQARLLDLFREKYAEEHFDGVILTDDHALDFVAWQIRQTLFAGTPMVACGINDIKSVPPGLEDMNIIIESIAHLQTIDAALEQNPRTRKIYVMIDSTLTGKSILRDFLEQAQALEGRVEVEVLPRMTREELVDFAGQRVSGELIYLLVYFQDAAGQVFTSEEIPKAVAAASPVPVYVAWDFQMGTGVVGGCVTSAFGHGRKAARTLMERLAGGNPPHVYSGLQEVNRYTYDYGALERFSIPLSALPEDAIVLNRPMSYYEMHRSVILWALGVITVLGVIIALLIMNVRKQRRINRGNVEIMTLNREMIDTQRELLASLGEVIETRSHETANHVRRVAAYAALLGGKYGLGSEDIMILEAAAPMHDIGKIGIPDSILNKPGRLSPEEYESVKHHTVIGQRILHSSDRRLMAEARNIALQHHERWDGTGYPCGLKGEEISLGARICALADVYDALSLRRVYKKAWPRATVLDFIRRERGGMFDPRIVDLFFENLDEIDAIGYRLADTNARPKEMDISVKVECPNRE